MISMIDFVNICGIIDHHGLNFLFKSYQNLKNVKLAMM
jgi:hypothetical protein